MIEPHVNARGYSETNLYGIVRLAHIITASAFGLTPNSIEDSTVDHKIVGHENRSHNHINDLELISHAKQIRRSYRLNKKRKSGESQQEKPILYKKKNSQDVKMNRFPFPEELVPLNQSWELLIKASPPS